MKSKLRSYGLRAKSSPAAFTVLMWFVALLYWEIILHVVAFGGFHWRNFYMLGFTALIAVLASLLCTMFPRRINLCDAWDLSHGFFHPGAAGGAAHPGHFILLHLLGLPPLRDPLRRIISLASAVSPPARR